MSSKINPASAWIDYTVATRSENTRLICIFNFGGEVREGYSEI